MRAVIVAALIAVGLLAGPADTAQSLPGPCRLWHGEQHCRRAAQVPIPTRGELRAKPRDCRTSAYDRRRDCGSWA